LLIGATEMGVSHAAFRLLEELGCRWFFPGKNWEVVPSIKNPQVWPRHHRPARDFSATHLVWLGHQFGGETNPATGLSPEAEYQAWRRRNQQAQSFQVNAGHAWESIMAAHKAEFDAHPRIPGAGRRQSGKAGNFCVSNAACASWSWIMR
jgi:hypothetical protein